MMISSLAHYMQQRKQFANQFFASPGSHRTPGSDRTIMVPAHVWWVDAIIYSLLRMGYNVLAAEPWYYVYTDDQLFANYDRMQAHLLKLIDEYRVQLVLGGNSAAMLMNPKTGEMLHDAAGVPLVNYWWDEVRTEQPMMQRGITNCDYLRALQNENTLNVIWDADVEQELRKYCGLNNTMHAPLATCPELWPPRSKPMAQRTIAACFLGNCFDAGSKWREQYPPQQLELIDAVVAQKQAEPHATMVECIAAATERTTRSGVLPVHATAFNCDPASEQQTDSAFAHWQLLSIALRQQFRYERVRAMTDHLGDDFIIFGKGWEALGLTASGEHAGVPGSADYYIDAKASLNLFGGCIHSGQPLRPYEIACSGGLIFTQYTRELPDLFTPGRECVAFNDVDDMLAQLDHILRAPHEFDHIIEAGRRRALTQHTWTHRLERILAHAIERFDLPWQGAWANTPGAGAGVAAVA